jgi:hypothetical protein
MRPGNLLLAPTLALGGPAALLPAAIPLTAAAATEPARGAAADTDFLFRLALMEGHLMVGHELLQAGRQPLALPHFGHPVRELYDDIEPELRRRNLPGFEADLLRLEAAATAAPMAAETTALYQSIIATLGRARESVPASLRASVPHMIRLCADVLDVAAGEYGEAIERGRIRNIVEYHDARGFMLWARNELSRLQSATASGGGELMAGFRPAAEKMYAVVEALLPTGAPRSSVSEYRALARQAREAAGQ